MGRNYSNSAQPPSLLHAVSIAPAAGTAAALAPANMDHTQSDDEDVGRGLRLNLSLMANTRQSSTKSAPSSLVRENVSRSRAQPLERESRPNRSFDLRDSLAPGPLNHPGSPTQLSLSPSQSQKAAEDERELAGSAGLLKLSIASPLSLSSPSERGSGKRRLSNSSREPKIWKFRGVITQVCECLFVGDVNAAKDFGALQKLNITHVLNCAAANIDNFHANRGLTYKRVTMEDNPTEDIFCLFYDVLRFIEEAVANGGRVLVHCNYGISRSSTMAICYLMYEREWGYDRALAYLKSVRSICEPNAGYVLSLMNWERHRADPSNSLPALFSITEREEAGAQLQTVKLRRMPELCESDCLLLHHDDVIDLFTGRRCSEERNVAADQLVENLQRYARPRGSAAEVKRHTDEEEFRGILEKHWEGRVTC
mmetsp:Transcript_18522/g.71509  ORF Transcript_18522/g.71509 Transcript_18522/m.71509 type:complete len:425 (+) Transcript_18522:190-1464(+)